MYIHVNTYIHEMQARVPDFEWGGALRIFSPFLVPDPKFLAPHSKFANRWGARGSGGALNKVQGYIN